MRSVKIPNIVYESIEKTFVAVSFTSCTILMTRYGRGFVAESCICDLCVFLMPFLFDECFDN